jgi:hypothetical protein
MRWAFSDESRQGNRYCVVAVVVETHSVKRARSEIERFRMPRQRRVHMTKESRARRRQFLDLLALLPLEAHAVEVSLRGRPMSVARDLALAQLVRELLGLSIADWRLEQMAPARMDVDRAVIASALADAGAPNQINYDHLEPFADPLLWAADAYAWAVLAGLAQGVPIHRIP